MKRPLVSSVAVLAPFALAACVVGEPVARCGAISSASPEATRVGIEILRGGGNAVDAAVAVSLALGVSEPAGSGIGGQVFVLLQAPGEPAVVIHGSTRAPAAIPDDVGAESITGRRATTVPSALAVLDVAHRRYGSGRWRWAELVEPAARIAERGFVAGPFRRSANQRYAPQLDLERRPNLAKTLRRIAGGGAEVFYRGAVAREIAADMAQYGGWLTYEDLAGFPEPIVGPALLGSYRDYAVATLPPPAGGWVVLHALNSLDQESPAALHEPVCGTIAMSEALRAAHAARLDHPVGVGAGRERQLKRHLDKGEAARRHEDWFDGGETTHFSVVDTDGLMVSVTQSINSYFGAKVAHPTLGFLYNDYMREFVLGDPDHPFALRPNALPFSSMSATILSRGGQPVLALGSPGSRRIVSAVVQVISNHVDRGLDLTAAVAAPRLHVVPETNALRCENAPSDRALVRELERRGFRISTPITSLDRNGLSPYFGGVHAVAVTGRELDGAADPRRDGVATLATY